MGEEITAFDIIKNPNKVLIRDVRINDYSVTPVADFFQGVTGKTNTWLSADERFKKYVDMNLVESINVGWGTFADFSIELVLFDPYGWLVDALVYSTPYGESNCEIKIGWHVSSKGKNVELARTFRGRLITINTEPLVEGFRYRLLYIHFIGFNKVVNADNWFSVYTRVPCIKNNKNKNNSKTYAGRKVKSTHNDELKSVTAFNKKFAYTDMPLTLDIIRTSKNDKIDLDWRFTSDSFANPVRNKLRKIKLPDYIISLYPLRFFTEPHVKKLPKSYYGKLKPDPDSSTVPRRRAVPEFVSPPKDFDNVGRWFYFDFSHYALPNMVFNHWWFAIPHYDLINHVTKSLVWFHTDNNADWSYVPTLSIDAVGIEELRDLSMNGWINIKEQAEALIKKNRSPQRGREFSIRVSYPDAVLKKYLINNSTTDLANLIKNTKNLIEITTCFARDDTSIAESFTAIDLLKPFADYYDIDIEDDGTVSTLHSIMEAYEVLMGLVVEKKLYMDKRIVDLKPYSTLFDAYKKEKKDYTELNKLATQLGLFTEKKLTVTNPFEAYTHEIPLDDFFRYVPQTLNHMHIPGNLVEFRTAAIPTRVIDYADGNFSDIGLIGERLYPCVIALPKGSMVETQVIGATAILPNKYGYFYCTDPLQFPSGKTANYASGLTFIVDMLQSLIDHHLIACARVSGHSRKEDININNDYAVKVKTKDLRIVVSVERAARQEKETDKGDITTFEVRRSYITNRDFGNTVTAFRVLNTELLIHGISSTDVGRSFIDPITKRIRTNITSLKTVLENREVPLGDNKTSVQEGGIDPATKLSKEEGEETGLILSDSFVRAMERNYTLPALLAELELVGDPDIEPFEYISVKVLRPDFTHHYFSGIYQVLGITHNIASSNFTTVLSLVRSHFTIGDIELTGVREFKVKDVIESIKTPVRTKEIDEIPKKSAFPSGDIGEGEKKLKEDKEKRRGN